MVRKQYVTDGDVKVEKSKVPIITKRCPQCGNTNLIEGFCKVCYKLWK